MSLLVANGQLVLVTAGEAPSVCRGVQDPKSGLLLVGEEPAHLVAGCAVRGALEGLVGCAAHVVDGVRGEPEGPGAADSELIEEGLVLVGLPGGGRGPACLFYEVGEVGTLLADDEEQDLRPGVAVRTPEDARAGSFAGQYPGEGGHHCGMHPLR